MQGLRVPPQKKPSLAAFHTNLHLPPQNTTKTEQIHPETEAPFHWPLDLCPVTSQWCFSLKQCWKFLTRGPFDTVKSLSLAMWKFLRIWTSETFCFIFWQYLQVAKNDWLRISGWWDPPHSRSNSWRMGDFARHVLDSMGMHSERDNSPWAGVWGNWGDSLSTGIGLSPSTEEALMSRLDGHLRWLWLTLARESLSPNHQPREVRHWNNHLWLFNKLNLRKAEQPGFSSSLGIKPLGDKTLPCTQLIALSPSSPKGIWAPRRLLLPIDVRVSGGSQ